MYRPAQSAQAVAQASMNHRRSGFTVNQPVKMTMDSAELFVINWEEIIPGDSINYSLDALIRMQPSIYTVMDNAIIETFFFFTPYRLIWEHWEEFITGGDDPSAWTEPSDYTVPQIKYTQSQAIIGSLYDYMDLPIPADEVATAKEDFTDKDGVFHKKGEQYKTIPVFEEMVDARPFRSYNLIVNEFFRDENVEEKLPVYTDDDGDIAHEYQTYTVNKYHDLFTSALPAPSKGSNVTIPLGGQAPVKADSQYAEIVGGTKDQFGNIEVGIADHDYGGNFIIGTLSRKGTDSDPYLKMGFVYQGGEHAIEWHNDRNNIEGFGRYDNIYGLVAGTKGMKADIGAINPYADLTEATGATINQLRLAFAIQELCEALARGGSRYIEYLKFIFGVDGGDYRLQRPEYLGGGKLPVNMTQVTQTSETSTESPLGSVAGLSKTSGKLGHVKAAFTEHGILMILGCIRNLNSYGQALDKKWSKKTPLDHYNPYLDHIGEVPILKKEVAFIPGSNDNDQVFGYQEAHYEYRYRRASVKGLLRPGNSDDRIQGWTYVDHYTTSPSLNEQFMKSNKRNIGDTLAVTGQPQFIGDFLISGTIFRPMSIRSTPNHLGRIE